MLVHVHHGCSLKLKCIKYQYGDLQSRDGLECDLLYEILKPPSGAVLVYGSYSLQYCLLTVDI